MALFRKKAETAIPALIAAIYDAALEPAKWQYFVDSLRHELCAVEPAFYTGDAARLPVEILYIGKKWGGVHFDPKDSGKGLAAKLREAPPVGELTRQDLMFSDGSTGDAEFFRNLGAKRVFGVVTHRSRAALSVLQLYYARAMLRRDRRRLRRFVARIVPHISRALQISRRLRHEAGRNATLELTLDRFVSPALLIGGDLRVHYANDAAKAIFCSGALALDTAVASVRADGLGKRRSCEPHWQSIGLSDLRMRCSSNETHASQ